MKTGELITGRPKSDAGARVVTLTEIIVDDLVWHLQRFAKSGLPEIPIRDLRHTGNTLAAVTGAIRKELMTRMGRFSTKAAMVYLHAAKDRDRAIADAMGEIVKQGLASAEDDDEDQAATEAKIN
ncbi:hypothetical protein [Microbispora sp. NPDC049125]|uniref:hypothetical protein n=1 Tax=Microbispora sp. NPDC049125 TaxID=3154929 RepID=UPI0034659D8C